MDEFLKKENADVLWEVITDNENVQQDIRTQTTFAQQLPRFYAQHNRSYNDLMEMNKAFISYMLTSLADTSSSSGGDTINGSMEELYTHDQIQTNKREAFDEEFQKKQADFEGAMKLNIPDPPNFSDIVEDGPIEKVDEIIRRTIEERNLDMSYIEKNQPRTKKAEQWVKSKDSSIATERAVEKEQVMRTIKIGSEELPLQHRAEVLHTPHAVATEKHVQWEDTQPSHNTSREDRPVSLFSKLKQKPVADNNTSTASAQTMVEGHTKHTGTNTTEPYDAQDRYKEILGMLETKMERMETRTTQIEAMIQTLLDNDTPTNNGEDADIVKEEEHLDIVVSSNNSIMKKTDIIMLVIASRGDRYDSLINNYWSKMIKYTKLHHDNIKIFLLFGNDVNTDGLEIADDDKLILNVRDGLVPGVLNKTIEAFSTINTTYSYKHIIRTNLSSFFILDNVIRISNELESTNIYAGINVEHKRGFHRRIPFISGAGIWLSKDNIDYIINNRSSLDKKRSDDASIGRLLINHKKSNIGRYDLTNANEILDKTTLINSIIDNKYCHIRVKSNNTQLDIDYVTTFADILYKL